MSDAEPLTDLIRPQLRLLTPYRPGTTVEQARRRYGLERIVKLSSNENPWGSSPRAVAALREISSLHRYVDDYYPLLREKIAQRLGVVPEALLFGHGSNEILAQVMAAFVSPGDEVIMAVPSFALYRSNALVAGAHPIEVPLRDGVHDLAAMAAAVTPRTRCVILCDPNNPTGTQVKPEAFAAFVAALPERLLLVLDQAYREYADGGVDGVAVACERPRTVTLRTASKIYGLAALRFGYAVTSPDMARWLERIRLPFNVGLPALVAVDAALDDVAFIEHSIIQNAAQRERIVADMVRLGLAVYPSEANFIAVHVPTSATEAYEGLLRRGVIVRSGDGLRMPGALRITVGTPEENTSLLLALAAFLTEDVVTGGGA